MTDKHDKLVEMALDAGFHAGKTISGQRYAYDGAGIDVTKELAAFADAHVASLCADVEPVAFGIFASNGNIRFWACDKASADSQAAKTGGDVVGIYPASTVASLTAQRDQALARVAELEKDAARGRLLLKWLWSGHIPGPAWGRPIKLVETCPQFGDETEVKNIEALLDAALTKGQP